MEEDQGIKRAGGAGKPTHRGRNAAYKNRKRGWLSQCAAFHGDISKIARGGTEVREGVCCVSGCGRKGGCGRSGSEGEYPETVEKISGGGETKRNIKVGEVSTTGRGERIMGVFIMSFAKREESDYLSLYFAYSDFMEMKSIMENKNSYSWVHESFITQSK